ncbi:hypothetical protein HDV00_011348 [Rhizophlyctis rosea]|nr:hypothetical protein HDV00_011348 [Rhizophlyctis rosea]
MQTGRCNFPPELLLLILLLIDPQVAFLVGDNTTRKAIYGICHSTILEDATTSGDIAFLIIWYKWVRLTSVKSFFLRTNLPRPTISCDLIDIACANGHTNILDFWFQCQFIQILPYTSAAFTFACQNGNVAVLNWFKRSQLPMLFDHCSMDEASMRGHIAILQWIKENVATPRYSS